MQTKAILHSWLSVAAGLALGLSACQSPPNSSTPAEAQALPDSVYLSEGKQVAEAAFGLLSSNLSEQLQAGGVQAAVPFCKAEAATLTDSSGASQQVTVRRFTDLPRNADNLANGDEMQALAVFREAKAAGQKPAPFVTRTGNTVTYYQPIVLGMEVCLQCHGKPGQDISPDNLALITGLYPDDKATGYALGELRGGWRVDWKLN